MSRRRITQIAPWLLPLRRKQRLFCFYLGMRLDGRRYAREKGNRLLLYRIFEADSALYNHETGFDMIYQENKVHNLRLAAAVLDGVLIKPGETFSFWRLVRKADRDVPYRDGLIVVDGVLTTAPGGGLCQMSNLLFWLFLHTPLTIAERHGHKVRHFPDPPGGAPTGTDATVSEGWRDLKVKNDTDITFQISLSFDEKKLTGRILADRDTEVSYEITNSAPVYLEEDGRIFEEVDVIRTESEGKQGEEGHSSCILYRNRCEICYPLPEKHTQTDGLSQAERQEQSESRPEAERQDQSESRPEAERQDQSESRPEAERQEQSESRPEAEGQTPAERQTVAEKQEVSLMEAKGAQKRPVKRIAVIFGGCSPEYGVSLESAHAVIGGLEENRYEVIPVGISKEGEWFLFRGDRERIASDTWQNGEDCTPAAVSLNRSDRCLLAFTDKGAEKIPVDAVFPVLHGKNGEDGTVQGVFELAGIPLVGCGVLASALCMDKDRAHRLAAAAGIRVPASFVVRRGSDFEEIRSEAEKLGYPLFVKPMRAGSSFGITRVSGEDGLEEAVERAFAYDGEVIVEEFIPGFEVGCAVLGNGNLTVGEVDEIELADGFFDYTEKYTLKTSAIHVPARIAPETAEDLKDTACAVYRAMGCRGFARVDMFLTPTGEIVFNEVNTIPGFTAHSRYPSMMKAAGLPFGQVLAMAVDLALYSSSPA